MGKPMRLLRVSGCPMRSLVEWRATFRSETTASIGKLGNGPPRLGQQHGGMNGIGISPSLAPPLTSSEMLDASRVFQSWKNADSGWRRVVCPISQGSSGRTKAYPPEDEYQHLLAYGQYSSAPGVLRMQARQQMQSPAQRSHVCFLQAPLGHHLCPRSVTARSLEAT